MEVESALALTDARPQQGAVTGLIRPPPDIRVIVDKTALFVARNGKSFESRILSSAEGQSAKFSFMKSNDPYNAYYEFKIRECEENGGELKVEAAVVLSAAVDAPKKTQAATTTVKKAPTATPTARALKGVDVTVAPRPLTFKLPHPTTVSPVDADVIKLTAQFTAASGRQFLSGLAQREQRNPQFDFLKPTHVLFSYFTALVDAYTKALAPSPELLEHVSQSLDGEAALRRTTHRWEYTRRSDEAVRREKAVADADKVAYQSVDWHDFVVVEVIDFPSEELAEEAPAEAEMEVDTSGVPPPPPPPPMALVPLPPPPPRPVAMDEEEEAIQIVTDYTPRVAQRRQAPQTMIDPLTGNEVPIDRMTEHMRIQLLDPKWRGEQKRLAARGDSTKHLAAGEQIADSLSAFARQRNDIFGSTEDEETALLEEARVAKARADDDHGRIIWDGHGSSINRVQAKVLDILNEEAKTDAVNASLPAALQPQAYAMPLLSAPPGMGFNQPPPPTPPPPPPPPPPPKAPPPPPMAPPPPISAPPIMGAPLQMTTPFAMPPPPPPGAPRGQTRLAEAAAAAARRRGCSRASRLARRSKKLRNPRTERLRRPAAAAAAAVAWRR